MNSEINTKDFKPIGNKGEMTPESEFFAIATEIFTVPIVETDAFVTVPGIVLEEPTQDAAKMWNKGVGKYFLIVGNHEPKVVERLLTIPKAVEYFRLERANKVHSQGHARHTADQAEWLAGQVKDLGIKSITLCAPAFHLPRVFMTILEAFRRTGLQILIIPRPTPVSPFENSVLDTLSDTRNLNQMDVIYPEVKRMIDYRKEKSLGVPGDVATTEVFYDHLKWTYEHPLIKKVLISGK